MKTCGVWHVSGLGVSRRGTTEVHPGDGLRGCRQRCVVAQWECVIWSLGQGGCVGVMGGQRS